MTVVRRAAVQIAIGSFPTSVCYNWVRVVMTSLFFIITSYHKLWVPSCFVFEFCTVIHARTETLEQTRDLLPNIRKQKRHSTPASLWPVDNIIPKKMSFPFGINTTFGMQLINESFKNQSEWALKISSHPLELFEFLLITRIALLMCGILLNFVVVYVMLRSRKMWKNTSSFLVFHLSLIHVFLYFLLPILYIIFSSISPAFQCAAEEFVQHMFSSAIFGTLAAISGDRYRNIVQPFKSLAPRRLKTFLLLILGIWLFALATTMPVIFSIESVSFCQKEENVTAQKCYQSYCYWPSKGKLPKTMYFFLAFLLPFIVILLTYTKAALSLWKWTKNGTIHLAVAKHKAKTMRLMVMAVCIFALGWGPKLFLDCLGAYSVFNNLPSSHSYTLREACEVAESLSSCLNPILYAFFSPDFRKLCYQFCCCCCRHRPSCIRHRRFCFNSVHP